MDYSLQSVSSGIEALASTRVAIRPDGRMASEAFVTSYRVRGLQWHSPAHPLLFEPS